MAVSSPLGASFEETWEGAFQLALPMQVPREFMRHGGWEHTTVLLHRSHLPVDVAVTLGEARSQKRLDAGLGS